MAATAKEPGRPAHAPLMGNPPLPRRENSQQYAVGQISDQITHSPLTDFGDGRAPWASYTTHMSPLAGYQQAPQLASPGYPRVGPMASPHQQLHPVQMTYASRVQLHGAAMSPAHKAGAFDPLIGARSPVANHLDAIAQVPAFHQHIQQQPSAFLPSGPFDQPNLSVASLTRSSHAFSQPTAGNAFGHSSPWEPIGYGIQGSHSAGGLALASPVRSQMPVARPDAQAQMGLGDATGKAAVSPPGLSVPMVPSGHAQEGIKLLTREFPSMATLPAASSGSALHMWNPLTAAIRNIASGMSEYSAAGSSATLQQKSSGPDLGAAVDYVFGEDGWQGILGVAEPPVATPSATVSQEDIGVSQQQPATVGDAPAVVVEPRPGLKVDTTPPRADPLELGEVETEENFPSLPSPGRSSPTKSAGEPTSPEPRPVSQTAEPQTLSSAPAEAPRLSWAQMAMRPPQPKKGKEGAPMEVVRTRTASVSITEDDMRESTLVRTPEPMDDSSSATAGKTCNPHGRFVLRVTGVPPDVGHVDFKNFLQPYAIYPHPIQHFVLDRNHFSKDLSDLTPQAKHILSHRDDQLGAPLPIREVFVEVPDRTSHNSLLAASGARLRGHDVHIEESSQGALLRALFPRANSAFKKGASGRKRSSGAVPGEDDPYAFVGKEEIAALNLWCANHKAFFPRNPSIPFEQVCSILHKVPWDHEKMTEMQRNALYELAKISISYLSDKLRERKKAGESVADVNEVLMLRVLKAGMYVPAFTDRQRWNILKCSHLPAERVPQDLRKYLTEPPRSGRGDPLGSLADPRRKASATASASSDADNDNRTGGSSRRASYPDPRFSSGAVPGSSGWSLLKDGEH